MQIRNLSVTTPPLPAAAQNPGVFLGISFLKSGNTPATSDDFVYCIISNPTTATAPVTCTDAHFSNVNAQTQAVTIATDTSRNLGNFGLILRSTNATNGNFSVFFEKLYNTNDTNQDYRIQDGQTLNYAWAVGYASGQNPTASSLSALPAYGTNSVSLQKFASAALSNLTFGLFAVVSCVVMAVIF